MKKKANSDWKVRKRSVYLFLFEETKGFFINDTIQKNLWHVYEEHYREKRKATKKEFAQYKKEEKLPAMFLLEALEGTASDAFQYQISWSRYFIAHGYVCLAGKKMVQIVENTPEEEDLCYQNIKNRPIEEVCAPEKSLYPNFGRERKGSSEREQQDLNYKRFEMRLSNDQYSNIKTNAEAENLTMTEYVLRCIRKQNAGKSLDGDQMKTYLKRLDLLYDEICGYQKSLEDLLSALILGKNYLPRDAQFLLAVNQHVEKLIRELKTEILRLYRLLRRTNYW